MGNNGYISVKCPNKSSNSVEKENNSDKEKQNVRRVKEPLRPMSRSPTWSQDVWME